MIGVGIGGFYGAEEQAQQARKQMYQNQWVELGAITTTTYNTEPEPQPDKRLLLLEQEEVEP